MQQPTIPTCSSIEIASEIEKQLGGKGKGRFVLMSEDQKRKLFYTNLPLRPSKAILRTYVSQIYEKITGVSVAAELPPLRELNAQVVQNIQEMRMAVGDQNRYIDPSFLDEVDAIAKEPT